jgi:UDP-N-acetylmuramoylalanine--D-glutamate ligase
VYCFGENKFDLKKVKYMTNINKDKYIQYIANKKIAILGYGINNRKLVDWLLRYKVKDITILDKSKNIKDKKNNVKFELGENYLDHLNKFQIIFRTPGIPYLHPKIQLARQSGVEISSQTNLFFKLCPGKIIGITGTKGKGTTATLVYNMLKKQSINSRRKFNAYLAGNMGIDPFEYLDDIKSCDWVVMELSSFQLQDMDISPHVAVILNITSDHLDYHKNNQEYIKAKSNIARYQRESDYLITCRDSLITSRLTGLSLSNHKYYFSTANKVNMGTYVDWKNMSIIYKKDREEEIIKISQIKLIGTHNLENVCASVTAAKIASVNNQYIRFVLESFSGNEHRLEFVDEVDGIGYYNDSASTNPDTTIAAIKSFDKPIVLIAGGSDKGLKFDGLKKVLDTLHIKKLILMGDTASVIGKMAHKDINIVIVNSMKQAIDRARRDLDDGDVVLLSPASASFGMFKNYQDRGKQFKKYIRLIRK